MEIPIPRDAYTGPATPFGGASLEWEFGKIILVGEEEGEDTRISVYGIPIVIPAIISHIRRYLKEEYPKSSANVQRKVTSMGIPIIERIIERNHFHLDRVERAIMSLTSPSSTRDLRMKSASIYEFDLGEPAKGSTSIYFKNKDYARRVRNMREDIGLTNSQIIILCLTAGLAQSVDPNWVPVPLREAFIKEIKFFGKWLEEQK